MKYTTEEYIEAGMNVFIVCLLFPLWIIPYILGRLYYFFGGKKHDSF